jgi:putative flippase GtrA
VTDERSGRRIAEMGAVIATGIAPPYVVLSTPLIGWTYAGLVLYLAVFGSFVLAYRWRLLRHSTFLGAWVGVSLALALFSVLTGHWNGLTDEPYTTPAFARLWPNLYGSPLHLVYYQYGSGPYSFMDYNVYLPLLTFIQAPGVDYRWVTLGAWLLMVWWVRKSGATVTLLAAPWVGLLAANGFNDFVPLAALTATFVALSGWRSRLAEVLSLGLKQFANIIVVAVHLWRRRWSDALLAVGVTVAFLAPFVYLDPSAVWCHVVLASPSGCAGAGGLTSVPVAMSHLNYLLWPAWLLAVFGGRYVAGLHAPAGAPVRAEAASAIARIWPSGGVAPPEALVVLVAPYVQLRRAVRAVHPELWTAAKYCTVGATGVAVNLLVFTGARGVLGPAPLLALVASTIAFGAATCWNFGWNYVWTFRDRHHRPVLLHGVGFVGSALAALSANLAVLYALEGSLPASVAQFLGILAGTAFSFGLNRGINFADPRRASAS